MTPRLLARVAVIALFALPALAAASPEGDFHTLAETGRLTCASPAPRVDAPSPRVDAPSPRGDAPEAVPSAPVVALQGVEDLRQIQWFAVPVDSISAPISFVVRDGVVGLTIRAEIGSDEYDVEVQLFDAIGEQLNCASCLDAPAVGEIRAGRGVTQMPSTDRDGWELIPGRYSFRVRTIPKETVIGVEQFANVVATMRGDVAADVEHVLDLNFVYLPECNVSVASATTDPHFAVFLERVATKLASTGIRIGEITHNDLARPQFSLIESWSHAGAMFRTSAAVGRDRALNVYCIEKFVDELNNVGGLSGGIPGPLWNGTRDSGIALTTRTLFSCPDCVDAYASLVAHEVGHYLGLYHTTEADYTSSDPFSDTPLCTKEESGNDLRQCPDWEYVMFPVFHDSSSLWSPGQASITNTHPIVRTVAVVNPAAGADALAVAFGSPFRDRVALVALRRDEPLAGMVFDVTGKRVRDLGPSLAELVWNGLDEDGASVGAGVYFVRLVGGARSETHRVVKLR